jgi:hypothetical protein
MNGKNWLGVLFVVGAGLVILNEISRAKWCGPNCKVIVSDFRGALVQDLVTGALRWV